MIFRGRLSRWLRVKMYVTSARIIWRSSLRMLKKEFQWMARRNLGNSPTLYLQKLDSWPFRHIIHLPFKFRGHTGSPDFLGENAERMIHFVKIGTKNEECNSRVMEKLGILLLCLDRYIWFLDQMLVLVSIFKQ